MVKDNFEKNVFLYATFRDKMRKMREEGNLELSDEQIMNTAVHAATVKKHHDDRCLQSNGVVNLVESKHFTDPSIENNETNIDEDSKEELTILAKILMAEHEEEQVRIRLQQIQDFQEAYRKEVIEQHLSKEKLVEAIAWGTVLGLVVSIVYCLVADVGFLAAISSGVGIGVLAGVLCLYVAVSQLYNYQQMQHKLPKEGKQSEMTGYLQTIRDTEDDLYQQMQGVKGRKKKASKVSAISLLKRPGQASYNRGQKGLQKAGKGLNTLKKSK